MKTKILCCLVLLVGIQLVSAVNRQSMRHGDIITAQESDAQTLRLPLGGNHPDYALQRCLAWVPHETPKAVFLCLHGIQTFADWYGPLGREMVKRGHAVYALDRRGSGPWPYLKADKNQQWHHEQQGDCTDWNDWIDDITIAAFEIKKRHPHVPLILVGTSWGGKTALGALTSKNAACFDACVLLAPAFETTVDPGFFKNLLAGVMRTANPAKRVPLNETLRPELYSPRADFQHDWLHQCDAGSAQNPLLQSVTLRFVKQSKEQLVFAHKHLQSVKVPVLAMFGTDDMLVKAYESDQFLLRLREDAGTFPHPFPKLTSLLMKGLHHASLVEAPDVLADAILNWNARREHGSKHNDIWLPAYATGCGLSANGTCAATHHQLEGSFPGYRIGLQVVKGQTLTIHCDPEFVWQDRTAIPCGPEGLDNNSESIAHKFFRGTLLVSKTKDKKPVHYFTIVALIHQPCGGMTRELLSFDARSSTFPPWTVPETGELSFVANDATFKPSITYTNNHGTLHLTVHR